MEDITQKIKDIIKEVLSRLDEKPVSTAIVGYGIYQLLKMVKRNIKQ